MRCSCFLLFFLFYSTLVADIVASTAEDAFVLIDFIRNTDIDAALRAEECASAAGDAAVGNKEILFAFIHG